LLLAEPEQFPRTVTQKLMAYALGRRLEYYDEPAVRKIVRDSAAQKYRWSALILGIVQSPAFQMRTPLGPLSNQALNRASSQTSNKSSNEGLRAASHFASEG
jgi:hypothetical protein